MWFNQLFSYTKGEGWGGRGFGSAFFRALMVINQAVTNRRELINRLAVLEERIGLLEHQEKKGSTNETAGSNAPCMSVRVRPHALDQSGRHVPPVPVRMPKCSSRLYGRR